MLNRSIMLNLENLRTAAISCVHYIHIVYLTWMCFVHPVHGIVPILAGYSDRPYLLEQIPFLYNIAENSCLKIKCVKVIIVCIEYQIFANVMFVHLIYRPLCETLFSSSDFT